MLHVEVVVQEAGVLSWTICKKAHCRSGQAIAIIDGIVQCLKKIVTTIFSNKNEETNNKKETTNNSADKVEVNQQNRWQSSNVLMLRLLRVDMLVKMVWILLK